MTNLLKPRRPAVDSRCFELAEHFLDDLKGTTPADVYTLAETLQRNCDDMRKEIAMADDSEISVNAADAVRLKFNPSSNEDVANIKARTAALITIMEMIRDRNNGKAAREAAVAITNLQTASMWCVLAATKGL